MSQKLPAMPFWVDHYRNDTRGFTLEDHGVYLLLLMEMWSERGSIPCDDTQIARMLGVMPQALPQLMARVMPKLLTYGEGSEKRLTQKRLQKEWNYAVENSARLSEMGKLGAKKRWKQKQKLNSYGNGPANAAGNGKSNSTLRKKDITTTFTVAAREGEPLESSPAHDAGKPETTKIPAPRPANSPSPELQALLDKVKTRKAVK